MMLCQGLHHCDERRARVLAHFFIVFATFPLAPDTCPVDRVPSPPPANPRGTAVIDKRVHGLLEWDITEECPSSWGSPCTLVAKKNGSTLLRVDCRHILSRHIVRKSWPVPNPGACLDTVVGVKPISTAEVLIAFWQLFVAEEHIDQTAFITPTGKFCFQRMFIVRLKNPLVV